MQIIVKLTTGCNLNCIYCSEGDKIAEKLPITTIYKLVDDLPNLLDKYNEKCIDLLWHGGEPLLIGKKYLTDVMQYATEKLQKYTIRFLIQSNGTLIDDEWIKIFKKFDVKIGISLDGFKELHDENRKTKDNKPTFDCILKNIAKLKSADIPVSTLMVLNTEKTIDAKKLFDFIYENKLGSKIHAVIPSGRAENKTNEEINSIYNNYIKLMEDLYKEIMNTGRKVVIEPLDELMNAILGISKIRECSFNGSCGNNFMCLYPNGDMGFCGRASTSEQENLIYGNLNHTDLVALYESSNAQRIRNRQIYLKEHDCKNCSDWDLCHGGCSFEAVNATGNLETKYPNCELRKRLLKFLKTTGLELLKQSLLKEKQRYRILIKEKRKLIEEISHERK